MPLPTAVPKPPIILNTPINALPTTATLVVKTLKLLPRSSTSSAVSSEASLRSRNPLLALLVLAPDCFANFSIASLSKTNVASLAAFSN